MLIMAITTARIDAYRFANIKDFNKGSKKWGEKLPIIDVCYHGFMLF